MPYRVMRCAIDAGADVYVLGNAMSACLAHSRYCKKFVATDVPITGEADPQLANEINRWVSWFGIDMVLAGDVQATRSLIAMRGKIDANLFPMPTLEQFDRLNNKWFFTQMCGELGIKTPRSRTIADAEQLRAELVAGRIALPAIAKPINHDGSLGVIRLDPDNALAQTVKIDYGPIIVQEFIEGRDIGASIYCERGEIKAFIAHELRRATYRSLDDPNIYRTLAKIASHMGIDGVFNFDMRLAPDDTVHYLECNPRFFFKINLSMLAGVNFVRMGLNATGRAVTAPNPAPRCGCRRRWRKPSSRRRGPSPGATSRCSGICGATRFRACARRSASIGNMPRRWRRNATSSMRRRNSRRPITSGKPPSPV